MFFIIYLANSLKVANNRIESIEKEGNINANSVDNDEFHTDQQFADDISWIATSERYLNLVEQVVPETLKERNLFINHSKTEKYKISKDSDQTWKNCKLVGSKLDTTEDIKHRKTLANVAFVRWKKILCDKKISTRCKLRLFSALIESIFLYNCELWGITRKQQNQIDAIQRQFLRQIFGFRYTKSLENWPSNDNLYRKTKQIPWSVTIRKRRLSFFGHICRLPENTPARLALNEALKTKPKLRGGQKTTYLSVINNDLKELNLGIHSAIKKAGDRKEWRRITLEKSH